MVDHNDATHENLLRFNRLWTTEFEPDSLLIFSTGRSPHLFRELADEVPLLTPDVLVCSVGTEIFIRGQPLEAWERHLDEGWDRTRAAKVAARFADLEMQVDSEQRPHKASYKLRGEGAERRLGALRAALCDAGVDALVIYSGGEDLDILPSRAGKGKALAFLLKELAASCGGAPRAGVLVAGDSGNDVELFEVEGVHGCVVGNAHPELRAWCRDNGSTRVFQATQDGPGGIVEALERFDFVAGAHGGHPDPDALGRRRAGCWTSVWRESWMAGHAPKESMQEVSKSLGPGWEEITCEGELLSREVAIGRMEGQQRGSRRVDAQGGAFRLWVDRMSDRELAPGVCLLRFLELQQPFIPGKKTGAERTAMWVTGILRIGGGHYEWMHFHQTAAAPRQGASGAAGDAQ